MAFRLLVTGGRLFFDREAVFKALDAVHRRKMITELVHGGAAGADSAAGEWAEANGVPVKVFGARWREYGQSAGPRRNALMAEYGADGCAAFPGGKGTADMVRRCVAKGIPVWEPLKRTD